MTTVTLQPINLIAGDYKVEKSSLALRCNTTQKQSLSVLEKDRFMPSCNTLINVLHIGPEPIWIKKKFLKELQYVKERVI